MTEEFLDGLRQSLERLNRTGEPPVELLAPDFELHQASSIVDTAGVFHGPDAMRGSLGELRESFEDLTFDAEGALEAPGGEMVVLVHARGRGIGSGVEIDNRIAWVLTFRDGKVARMVIYEERAEALAAVGLQD